MFLAALTAALGADLEARLTTPSGEVKHLTFHDVDRGAPPPFEVQVDGARVRVTLVVSPSPDGWVIDAQLADVKKRGRVEVIAAPRVSLAEGQWATVKQGKVIPIPNTDPVEFRPEGWELELNMRQG